MPGYLGSGLFATCCCDTKVLISVKNVGLFFKISDETASEEKLTIKKMGQCKLLGPLPGRCFLLIKTG